ncbi:hypothetical protein ASPVEDRAFT_34944 [Aspergillus versicolor CBS 583.65]|uniref:CHAT domain-containing protein n=1 Tax=Aspergillus versicolor CBS 583.65 TaxID=1036611 RepID=A0A1L9Q4W2_ASPVE|nr:uncharacterized protein ASPVEDRAFT_34944 [Aspergillus versicolor CBS 583.65]OJJ08814.1 hypothetical protein ASPVEDRAFT_34944 [Aspergillus versicolor CBS 583.65]
MQAMSAANLVIEIKARSLPSSLTSQDTTHPARLAWALDLYAPGGTRVRSITVKDPVHGEQRRLCHWYLEEHVQKVPYSVGLANDARALLEEYPRRLWRELHLVDVISACGITQQESPKLLTLQISDKEYPSAESKNTVHQLFWETLEYLDSIITSGWKVVVERHLSPVDIPGSLTTRVRSRGSKEENIVRVNVLLVIARDTSRNPETYSDVRPFLAWGALNQVQNALDANGGPLKLHVEIARPGTFGSFKEHLRRAKETHGPGYFQIVHFDLHGAVKTVAGKKVGILYFNKERSTRTRPVPASSIARVLKEYEVPLVIMNACDSARAESGDDANIANVFHRKGSARNVLAMSFKISSAAVDLFLTIFYQSLLVDKLAFAAAARKARRVLRINMLRPARFGVQRELLDSFVPVLYGAGDGCVCVEDSPQGENPSADAASLPSAFAAHLVAYPVTPVGRDFDILRLEKVLCERQVVYLHGLPGAGKTCLLQYVSALWQQTRFVDAVVTVDLVKEKIDSAADFADLVLNQLLQNYAQVERSSLWSIRSMNLQSHDLDATKKIISRILDTCKVILIIDGLDMLSSPFRVPLTLGSRRVGASPQEVFDVVKSMFLLDMADERETRSRLILAGRRPDHEWLKGFLGPLTNAQSYELQNLELADSIELSQKILCEAGEDISKWESEDFDFLEAIIDLLQGVPLALKDILPIQQVLLVPWREFYDRLHSGLFNSLSDLRDFGPYPLVAELDYISAELPPDVFMFFLLFSLYWGQSAPLHAFERLFLASTTKEVSTRQREELESERFSNWAGPLLGFAVDRGYLRLDLSSNIAWVHPLFSIYGRAFIPKFNPHLQHPWMRELVLKSIQLILFTFKESQISPTDENAPDCCLKATKYGGDANVLTCIKLGLELSSTMDVTHWPIHFLQSYIRDHALPIYAAQSFLDFLSLCVGKSSTTSSLRSSPLKFCIEAVFCLVGNTRLSFWIRKRGEQITLLCISMLQELGRYREYDCDPDVTMSQLLLLSVLWEYRDALGWLTESFDAAGLASDIKKDILNNRQEIMERIGKTAMVNHATESKEGGSSPILQNLSQTESLRQDLDMLIQSLEEIKSPKWCPALDEDMQKESHGGSSDGDRFKKLINTYTLGAARGDLEELSRGGPLDVECDVPSKGDLPSPTLQGLEDATDTGDWNEVFHHHSKLLFTAIDNMKFHEADQHINAIRHICKMTGNLAILGPSLDGLKETVDQQRASFQLSLSLLPSLEGGHREGSIQIERELLSSRADAAPLHAFLANTWFNRIEAEEGSGGYIPSLSREKMLRLVQRHAKRFRNPHDLRAMQGQLESFLETMMSVKHAVAEREFTACFAHLGNLEQMLEKDEYLYGLFEGVDWIERIRQKCQKREFLVDRIYAQTAAIIDGDFNRAYSIIDEISSLDPTDFPVELSLDQVSTMLRSSTELEYLTREIEDAKTLNDANKVRELNTDYMDKWKKNKPAHIEEVEIFIAQNLNWLIQESMDNLRWQEGLKLCDEALEYYISSDEESLLKCSLFQNLRESCEAGLVNQSLAEA